MGGAGGESRVTSRELQRGQRVLIWKEDTIQWIPYLHKSRTREHEKEIEPT